MKANELLTHKDNTGTLVRPLYAPGLLLEDTDLTTAVDYTRSALQLAMRSLFGCGVVCGLEMAAKFQCERRKVQITVSAGVAIDCDGNLIEVPKDVELIYDPGCKPMPEALWLEVCYKTCDCKPASASCSEEEDSARVHRRSRDGFDIRVWRDRPKCACGCPGDPATEPQPDPTDCCGNENAETTTTPETAASAPLPASCDCYKDHLEGKCACDCGGNCVLLGVLTEPDGDLLDWKVDKTLRRFVRPMLLGARQCYCDLCVHDEPAEDPQPLDTYSAILMNRPYDMRRADPLRAARAAQIAAEERQYATKLALARVNTDFAGAKAEITRLKAIVKDQAVSAESKVAAQESLKHAELRLPELEQVKEKVTKRLDAQQTDLILGEKRIARLSIDRNIAAHQQELAYIDEKILQRPDGGDAILTKQRSESLGALKAEMNKLTDLK